VAAPPGGVHTASGGSWRVRNFRPALNYTRGALVVLLVF
jgi:hypothetical protein